MNKTNRTQSAPYEAVRSWLASPAGQEGMARLEALGGSWRPTDGPHRIVPEMGRLAGAPPLPDLLTYGSRAAFIAGVCWTLTWTSRLARQMENDQ